MTTAANPQIYPPPRKGRGGGVSIEQLGPVSAPRMRMFPWIFSITGASRRTISTPRLVGPAIIKDFTWYNSTKTDPPVVTVEIGTARAPVDEAGVALTTLRPFTVLTELLDPFGVMAGASGDGFPVATLPTANDSRRFPLDLIVTDSEFFAVVSVVNNSAQAERYNGWLRVLESVDPEALSAFL